MHTYSCDVLSPTNNANNETPLLRHPLSFRQPKKQLLNKNLAANNVQNNLLNGHPRICMIDDETVFVEI
jgi:hypothetical protein